MTTTKEWVNGRPVKHDHLFKDYPQNEPNGTIGKDGWFVHSHLNEPQHAHQLIAAWDEHPQQLAWFGPAHELPDPISSWDLT